MKQKVAVILSGCGVYDGAEIHESVLTLLRLVDRPSWGRMAVHAAVAVALLYTHVYSTFALIGVEAAVLVCPSLLRRMGRYWWTAAGIAVAESVRVAIGAGREQLAPTVTTGRSAIHQPAARRTWRPWCSSNANAFPNNIGKSWPGCGRVPTPTRVSRPSCRGRRWSPVTPSAPNSSRWPAIRV